MLGLQNQAGTTAVFSVHLLTRSIADGISPAALEPTLIPSVLLTARTNADAAMVPYVSSGYTTETRSVG